VNEGAKGIGVVSGGWKWRWWGYFIKLSLQNFHSWRGRWGQRDAPKQCWRCREVELLHTQEMEVVALGVQWWDQLLNVTMVGYSNGRIQQW